MRGRQKEPTTTAMVLETLRKTDDFLDYARLRLETGRSVNQVSAACFHLRKRHAIDVVVNPDGTGWWFALPVEEDNRSYAVAERVPESVPRKARKYTRRKKAA